MARATSKPELNLSLYLVTDSTPEILGDKNICDVVDQALEGGVTIVQYRDKHADTGVMIDIATKLHEITQRHGVPLLINDRIDVCLAVGAEGVHVGQDDMTLSSVRELLPSNAIVGVTASSVEEADTAIRDGADYLGIGTVFATPTKKDTKSIIGTQGVQNILRTTQTGTKHQVGCVAIGSINRSNVQRVLHQSASGDNRLNGVAVVSAIIAAKEPQEAARDLKQRIDTTESIMYAATVPNDSKTFAKEQVLQEITPIIKEYAKSSVLSHNMTNTVVQNFAANVCLATGSSPIMSLNPNEAADLAKLGGGLVINMGTITPDIMNAYLAGVKAYNEAGNPVVFDPVGGGATTVRREAIKTLMRGGFFDVIKGNEGEINAVVGSSQVQQRGVDSGPSTTTEEQKIETVQLLAQRENCIILMTGATDYLSDGQRTITISNGHPYLGKITGSGCALGSVIAGYAAVHREDKLIAVLAGLMHYELAAEQAGAKCSGPGSFIPAFLDELYSFGANLESSTILSSAKVEIYKTKQ